MAWIPGTSSNDFLVGSPVGDLIDGFAGNDVLVGGTLPGEHNGSGDVLRGGEGVDVLIAGRGYAALEGGAGNDVLLGGDGENVLYGQEGDDVLDGGGGLNTLWGQEGADVFVMSGGQTTVRDFHGAARGGDRIDLRSYGAMTFNEVISHFSQVGDDAVFSYNGDTLTLSGVQVSQLRSRDFVLTANVGTINGTEGADTIFAAWLPDGVSVYGHGGDDILVAGNGYASLSGGAGADVLLGGDGENVIYGQAGSDVLNGGAGVNTLWGDSYGVDEAADIFMMSRDSETTVRDFFGVARGGHDRIDIRSYDASLGFSGIMSRFTQVGEDAVFNHNGDTLILTGVQVASLTSEDFIF